MQLASREWRAIGLCFLGTVLLASTLVPRDWSRTHVGWLQIKLSIVLMLVLPMLVLFEFGLRRAKRARGVPNRSVIEMLTGLQAGMCIGVGNASLASGLQSTSKSWCEQRRAQQGAAAAARQRRRGVRCSCSARVRAVPASDFHSANTTRHCQARWLLLTIPSPRSPPAGWTTSRASTWALTRGHRPPSRPGSGCTSPALVPSSSSARR